MDKINIEFPPLLMKFWPLKYLEALQSGCLYFNPISKYREDFDKHNGDENEGGTPINPQFPISYAGITLPPFHSAMEFIDDHGVFLFCVSVISKKILRYDNDGTFELKKEFIDKMSKFGDYCFLFSKDELISKVIQTQSNYVPKFGYDSGRIIYRDINNFDDNDYKNAYFSTGRVSDRYFVKSKEKYELENEWRLMIFGSEQALIPNSVDGYSLNIGAFNYGYILECSKLSTFKLKPSLPIL